MAETMRTMELPVLTPSTHAMPDLIVKRTDETIRRVTLTQPDRNPLFEARVQHYWESWMLRRRLFVLAWAGTTIATLAAAIATGIVNADRLGLVPMWFVGGYGLYRLSRDGWPEPFDDFVAARERGRPPDPAGSEAPRLLD